jgi:hypothetical protein
MATQQSTGKKTDRIHNRPTDYQILPDEMRLSSMRCEATPSQIAAGQQ